MTDLEEPWRLTHAPGGYLLAPVGDEYVGDVSNVVFSNGWIARTGRRAVPLLRLVRHALPRGDDDGRAAGRLLPPHPARPAALGRVCAAAARAHRAQPEADAEAADDSGRGRARSAAPRRRAGRLGAEVRGAGPHPADGLEQLEPLRLRRSSEGIVRETADAMVATGMRDAGYRYVIIDDCWQGERDADGFIQPDPERFPSGMKALADYVHAKGLKLGLYSDAGWTTCGDRPGSRGHEYQDALSYARWGIDYLKYDWCDTDGLNAEGAYQTMRDALEAAGRPIVFGICEWGDNQPWEWGKTIGHLWRTTGDIAPCFDCEVDHGDWSSWGVLRILDMQEGLRAHAGPGHWNDPDMLEVGNGMSEAEDRAHFSMWAMLAAPLHRRQRPARRCPTRRGRSSPTARSSPSTRTRSASRASATPRTASSSSGSSRSRAGTGRCASLNRGDVAAAHRARVAGRGGRGRARGPADALQGEAVPGPRPVDAAPTSARPAGPSRPRSLATTCSWCGWFECWTRTTTDRTDREDSMRWAMTLIVLVALVQPAAAELAVTTLFGSDMVLQRDAVVPVWGTAAPAAAVTVAIAGHSVTATADAAGRWRAELPPMKAGGPHRPHGDGRRRESELQQRAGGRRLGLLGPVEHGVDGGRLDARSRGGRGGQRPRDPPLQGPQVVGSVALRHARRGRLGDDRSRARRRLHRGRLLLRPRAAPAPRRADRPAQHLVGRQPHRAVDERRGPRR